METSKNERIYTMKGIITSRTCPRCGHHEVGLTTRDGIFHPLKTGTLVQTIETSEGERPIDEQPSVNPVPGFGPQAMPPFSFGQQPDLSGSPGFLAEEEQASVTKDIWHPEPLEGDRRMRLKYGVKVPHEEHERGMTPELYLHAYLGKLRELIEKEVFMPVAVLLDRFFAAPHLASGNSEEIVEAMWEALGEIQEPVKRVSEWLKDQNDETFAALIEPFTKDELGNEPLSGEDAIKELDGLTLEGFLELMS